MDYFRSVQESNSTLRTRNNNLYDLTSTSVGIIGLGAIGSFTASALSRSAVRHLILVDDDIVGPENIGVQDFTIPQIGMTKESAVYQNCMSINPNAYYQHEKYRVEGSHMPYYLRSDDVSVHVMAVDSMESRVVIAKAYFDWVIKARQVNRLFIDARMGAETLQLYLFQHNAEPPSNNLHDYMDTWYSDEDGDIEPCARRATAYCSTFAGSIITSEIVKWVQGNPIRTNSLVFNFPSLLLDADVTYPKAVAES